MPENERLGVGFIGSGFIARFHMRSWVGVRESDIRGVWSPTKENREDAADYIRSLRVGDAKAYDSISDMVAAPEIDCIWICGPNHKRIENVQEIVHTIESGKGELRAIACEKPLARNVAEAKELIELVEGTDLLHGYLENQVFEPALTRGKEIVWRRGASLAGRPYMARASEEHSGPHSPWFWRADLQGGGVVTDMMCHSVEVARYLLTNPEASRESITPTKVSAQINTLKWLRPKYMENLRKRMGSEVDYENHPAEDFGRVSVTYEDEEGYPLVAELSTSWNFVGAGLRLNTELFGPEYSMTVDSLNTGNQVFFSREVVGEAGEDLVEKQNAEQGLMPYMSNESFEYGYTAQNRYFSRQFADGVQPDENFYAGLHVIEILMTAYMSAEQERTIEWKPDGLDDFIPSVAEGTWRPQ